MIEGPPRSARRDRETAERAIEANMPLVHSIARRYAGRAEYEDLIFTVKRVRNRRIISALAERKKQNV